MFAVCSFVFARVSRVAGLGSAERSSKALDAGRVVYSSWFTVWILVMSMCMIAVMCRYILSSCASVQSALNSGRCE